MFGAALVGTYTSVFIASPILIYLGVGTGRQSAMSGREDTTVDAPPRTPTPARR
jgi:preprotein translocase subunit SecF